MALAYPVSVVVRLDRFPRSYGLMYTPTHPSSRLCTRAERKRKAKMLLTYVRGDCLWIELIHQSGFFIASSTLLSIFSHATITSN
jgi:hypothetical protein